MKKAVLAAAFFFALGVFCYVGRSSGQAPNNASVAPTSASPTGGTRIAILNLTYVINNYAKFKNYKEEMSNQGNVTGSDSSADTTYHVATVPNH